MNGAIRIGKIIGIEIRIHYTWFIVFFLVVWSLAGYYFPHQFPEWGWVTNWTLGIIATILLFASVLFHELSHSYIGRRNNVVIKRITLFVFGGVAEMEEGPQKPSAEFKMAVAGPISSLFLAGIFWIITQFPLGVYVGTVSYYLFFINGILAIFNLLPAFPLDGGRILRSALWAKFHDIRKATMWAVSVSKFLALLLIFWGLAGIFFGNLIGGLWIAFIGWFIIQAAEASYKQLVLKGILSKVIVSDIMETEVPCVDPGISIQKIANDFFLQYKQGGFPVCDKETLLGMVTLEDVKKIPKESWPRVKVKEIMTKAKDLETVSPQDNAFDALMKMTKRKVGRLPVIKDGKFLGLVTRNSIIFTISFKG